MKTKVVQSRTPQVAVSVLQPYFSIYVKNMGLSLACRSVYAMFFVSYQVCCFFVAVFYVVTKIIKVTLLGSQYVFLSFLNPSQSHYKCGVRLG